MRSLHRTVTAWLGDDFVEVDLAILWIRIAVEAFATARVACESTDLKGDRLPHR